MTTIARRAALGGIAALPLAAPALAQGWPSRPIRIIVPFAAGGTTDLLARATADRLTESLGQPVVVENRGGAGGTLAGEAFARSEPDGHTLLVSTASLVCINEHLYSNLSFAPATDFEPVAMLAQQPNVLVVNTNALPVRDLPTLVAHIRAHPGQVSYASAGVGSQLHLTGEMFRAAAGLDMVHVPYRGSGPAQVDVIAGRVPMMFDGLGTALPHIRGGRVTCLGVCSAEENRALPGVPPVADTVPGVISVNWTGLFARAGTPREIVQRLDTETRRALQSPAIATLFDDRAFDPLPTPRAELPAFLASERVRWGEVVRVSGTTIG